jgi:NACalpha-BTF3-like transcription factor
MEAIQKAYNMGAKIRLEDLSSAAGIGIPTKDDEVVFSPQIVMGIEQYQQQKQMAASGMMPPQGMPGQQPPPGQPPAPIPQQLQGNPFNEAIKRALVA